MIVVPVHCGIETNLGAVGKEYHILSDSRFRADLIRASDDISDLAVRNDLARNKLGAVLEFGHDIRVDVPVVPRLGQILRHHECVKRYAVYKLALGAFVDERTESAVFGELHRCKRSFKAVFSCYKSAAGVGLALDVTERDRRKCRNLYARNKEFFRSVERGIYLLTIAAVEYVSLFIRSKNAVASVKRERIGKRNAAVLFGREKLCGLFFCALNKCRGLSAAFEVRARNTSSGKNVVELVYKQSFVERRNVVAGALFTLFNSVRHRYDFEVAQTELGFAVVALYGVLIRKSSSVEFQIKLAPVCVGVLAVPFKLLHKVADKRVARFGNACGILAAARKLAHLVLRSSAAVAEAERQKPLIGNGTLLYAVLDSVYSLYHVLGTREMVSRIKVREHLCTVYTLPVEGVVGELIRVVPAYFGSEEIIYSAPLHYLRDSCRVAEGIGQPEAV